jgi:hypothetical protein
MIITLAIAMFAIIWVVSQWIEFLFIEVGKLHWLEFLCRKCLTFWSSIIVMTLIGHTLFTTIAIASIAALLSYIAEEKLKI